MERNDLYVQNEPNIANIWQELLEANKYHREFRLKFLFQFLYVSQNWKEPLKQDSSSVWELIHKSLSNPREMRDAVELIEFFGAQCQIALIDDLINMVVRYDEPQEGGDIARKIITSLPKEWLDANFRLAVDCWLQREDAYKFEPSLLSLCAEIDPNLAQEFAEEALKSNDEGDHEVGQWILEDYLPKQQRKGLEKGNVK